MNAARATAHDAEFRSALSFGGDRLIGDAAVLELGAP